MNATPGPCGSGVVSFRVGRLFPSATSPIAPSSEPRYPRAMRIQSSCCASWLITIVAACVHAFAAGSLPGPVTEATLTDATTLERGRDPWVFRCVFEDRPRMLLIAAGHDLWFAFDPVTCGFTRIWKGDVAFRGKVWDFSQDSSQARGVTWAISESPPNWAIDEWECDGVTIDTDDATFQFADPGATITSPVFDGSHWSRLMMRFDERSRSGPVRVDVSVDGGSTWNGQWFESCLHVNDDNAWQWNFKELVDRSPAMRLRLSLPPGTTTKSIRNIALFGDRPAWTVNGESVRPMFRGYERRGDASVTILVRLQANDGRLIDARITPDRSVDGSECVASVTVDGLTADDVVQFTPPGRKPVAFQSNGGATGAEHTFVWTAPAEESRQ